MTDGTSTYAVYNYHSVVWDGGFGAGGDADTGVGADNPPAQVCNNLTILGQVSSTGVKA